MKQTYRVLLSILFIFIGVLIILIVFRSFLYSHHIDDKFLFGANCLLFTISMTSYAVQRKALLSTNPQAFFRGVYMSMIIKLFVCMITFTIYILNLKGEINQPALFISMGLYVLYTAVEVTGLMKAARKNNA